MGKIKNVIMKKTLWFLLFCFCFPCIVRAQNLHQYSDSIISNINKNDFKKAFFFDELSENIIKESKIVKDTTYAHYLYAKGVLNHFNSNESIHLLNESLNIWGGTSKKNYFKIMKIHYFLGASYYSIYNLDKNKANLIKSYKNYEKCYLINKEKRLPTNNNFSSGLYHMIILDTRIDSNSENYKEYAYEYLNLTKETINNSYYNSNVIAVYRKLEDFVGQEKLLKKYLLDYLNDKLERPSLLAIIYFQLYNNYLSQKDKYGNWKNTKDLIKYGEKAYYLMKSEKSNELNDWSILTIYTGLSAVFNYLKNNEKHEKYKKLYKEFIKVNEKYKYVSKKGLIFDQLVELIENKDYANFKKKFDEYEAKLKSNNDYQKLAYNSGIMLHLLEIDKVFKKEDVQQRLDYINLNKNKLTKKEQIDFECTLVEFLALTNLKLNQREGLKICNKNLNVEDVDIKLYFYHFKTTFELSLGYPQAIKTAYETLQIAINILGDNHPQLIRYYLTILLADNIGNNYDTTKIATSLLKILYINKLEESDIAAKAWYYLSLEAKRNNNIADWLSYANKSKLLFEKNDDDLNLSMYYLNLLNLADYNYRFNKFEIGKMYLEKIKTYLDENYFGFSELKSAYFSGMGDYYFYQNKFNKAKKNYQKAIIDGENQVGIEYKLIICDYLINRNTTKTITSLEKYDKENKSNIGAEIIYLLKYNLGNFNAAQKTLIDNLENIKSNNSHYFHLLSNNEQLLVSKSIADEFEYLNSFLFKNDSSFIKRYIDFRLYNKSLLLSNSFKDNSVSEKDKELFIDLRSNTILINKSIENKNSNIKYIEKLKSHNREIEKLLSINKKDIAIPAFKDLYGNLKQNEAYVEIIRINKQSKNAIVAPYIKNNFTDSISYGAIIIKRNAPPKFVLIDDTNQLENTFSSNFKNKIKNKELDTESYHLLFEKIENELKGNNKIYLVTDGVYNSINIEAIFNPIKEKYLIDYLKIQQIQNVRTIIDDKTPFKVSSTSKASLFGNPDFDLNIKAENTPEYLKVLTRSIDKNLLNSIKTDTRITPLIGTEKEITTLKSLLIKAECSVDLFSANTASEDNLKKVQSPDIMHIATHGYFIKDNETSKTKIKLSELINNAYNTDSYLKSGLLLAGAQNTLNGKLINGSNNGILTAEEAKSLNLKDTELVVLSACETGLGDNLVGQGVIGLQRAFMIAGAKSVIMSLWSVDDTSTQKLMTSFYSNWIKKNMGKSEAFYKAKLEMKKLKPEPYYWAGFVLLE